MEESVEGGFPITLPERATASTLPGAEVAGHIEVRINVVEFDSPTHALVNFDLFANGQQITATTNGSAVFEGGHWRMGRATWCDISGRNGVQLCHG
jgi:hypothetical protein